LIFAPSEIKFLASGGRGVILQRLDGNEQLLDAVAFGSAGLLVSGTARSGKPMSVLLRGAELESHLGKRASKGRKLPPRIKAERLLLPSEEKPTA
jgi:topoisomerase-4 subunit A